MNGGLRFAVSMAGVMLTRSHPELALSGGRIGAFGGETTGGRSRAPLSLVDGVSWGTSAGVDGKQSLGTRLALASRGAWQRYLSALLIQLLPPRGLGMDVGVGTAWNSSIPSIPRPHITMSSLNHLPVPDSQPHEPANATGRCRLT
ncbi:hypothetical protein B0T25DRAFT_359911 [Lasiosphaeria hispida]|uniref:Uncharacterized protein n=1 Tax=Lasiosphaeria hispida TaxID=260671 RepID=A0AAJ0M8U1_9PEZI|nr:hypothetical protein B0T25DRAFT_359911 [Lasiosphaeria hispida]